MSTRRRRCSLRSRSQQAAQVAQAGRRGRGLVELEPDFQVAAVQIELAHLMFLQEFNQLLQICNILWFHSFLDSPACGPDQFVQSSINALGEGVSTCPPASVTATMSSMRMPNSPVK